MNSSPTPLRAVEGGIIRILNTPTAYATYITDVSSIMSVMEIYRPMDPGGTVLKRGIREMHYFQQKINT